MWLENTRQLIPQICTKLSKGQKHQKNVKTDSPKLLGSADFFFSFVLYAVESAHDFHEKWMIQYIKYCFTKGNLECGQQHRENRWKSTTNSFKLFQCQTKWTRLGPRLKNPVHPAWPTLLIPHIDSFSNKGESSKHPDTTTSTSTHTLPKLAFSSCLF